MPSIAEKPCGVIGVFVFSLPDFTLLCHLSMWGEGESLAFMPLDLNPFSFRRASDYNKAGSDDLNGCRFFIGKRMHTHVKTKFCHDRNETAQETLGLL